MKPRHAYALAAALLCAGAAYANDGDTPIDNGAPADGAVRLEELVITAPRNPLLDSRQRLRMLLETSTPCLGCDAAPATEREGLLLGLLRFTLLATPPEPDPARRMAYEIRCADFPPGSDYLCR